MKSWWVRNMPDALEILLAILCMVGIMVLLSLLALEGLLRIF